MTRATSLYVNWAEERVKSKEVVDGTTCRDELMQTEIQKVGCFIYILDCSNSSSNWTIQSHFELVSLVLALEATEPVSEPITQMAVELINNHFISVQQKRWV